jgi:hypothetical protein
VPTVYAAQTAMDAQLMHDLLDAAGLAPRLTGESLQGGVGEVPPLGLVRVEVFAQHVAATRALIAAWEARTPTPEDEQALGAAALAAPTDPEGDPATATGLRVLVGLLPALLLFALIH